MLEIVTMTLGPVATNSYLVADRETRQAVVIDPAWDGKAIADASARRSWQIVGIWITHAHFDHMAGAADLVKNLDLLPLVALHPADLPLYQKQGGAALFGMRIEPGPEPGVQLFNGQILNIGTYQFEVRHTPGHTQGHVIFCSETEPIAFCGDVIFRGSIGRTDLPGGSFDVLIESIRSQILTLPDETTLYSGHGPETKVGIERAYNPFL